MQNSDFLIGRVNKTTVKQYLLQISTSRDFGERLVLSNPPHSSKTSAIKRNVPDC